MVVQVAVALRGRQEMVKAAGPQILQARAAVPAAEGQTAHLLLLEPTPLLVTAPPDKQVARARTALDQALAALLDQTEPQERRQPAEAEAVAVATPQMAGAVRAVQVNKYGRSRATQQRRAQVAAVAAVAALIPTQGVESAAFTAEPVGRAAPARRLVRVATERKASLF
jgi:hypothetical protein